MGKPAPAAWVLEWRIYPDRLSPPLRGKAKANATNRSFHSDRAGALAEQRRLKLQHAGNSNFISCVAPWEPAAAKPAKIVKPGQRKG